MLRITSGWAKSLALKSGASKLKRRTDTTVRPTRNVVRQALFDVLRPLIGDCLFIDLFAGSGAVGLEALANGARGCIFVEQDVKAVRTIRENIASFRRNADKQGMVLGKISCYRISVANFLQRYRFDDQAVLVWADPPYQAGDEGMSVLAAIGEQLRAGTGSYLCFESSVWSEVGIIPSWQRIKTRRYGNTKVDFFIKV
ncbi:MAG: RsmD family RNA methyltransferase [Pseudomonadota bacterium]|nr:RsmD family RNA methyltransferase [Pseudomonadota bacterium]